MGVLRSIFGIPEPEEEIYQKPAHSDTLHRTAQESVLNDQIKGSENAQRSKAEKEADKDDLKKYLKG